MRCLRAMWLMVASLAGCSAARVECPAYPDCPADAEGSIAVIGDTQHTLFIERLLLRAQSGDEPAVLVRDVVAGRPALLAHVGDAVSYGSSSGEWAAFDELMSPVRAAGIPLLPAMGNHDYFGNAIARAARWSGRFGWMKETTWYARRVGPLQLIWLDTNQGGLPDSQWSEQCGWFVEQLAAAQKDERVRGIIVFGHHPPYTNSTIMSDSRPVQQDLLPPFIATSKSLAFITGHCHSYEHFHEQGKDFIVTGGGGGPRMRLLAGTAERHHDLYQAPSPRPFNSVLLTPTATGVRVSVRGVGKGATQVIEMDSFSVDYAR